MRLFLQLNITDWKEDSFEKPLLSFASSLADDIVGTDIDSQSDAYVADLVMKLAGQSQEIFLFIIATSNLPMGIINSLLNNLLKDKEKVHQAVLCGDHAYAEKMLRPFGTRFSKTDNPEEIKKLIKDFAESFR